MLINGASNHDEIQQSTYRVPIFWDLLYASRYSGDRIRLRFVSVPSVRTGSWGLHFLNVTENYLSTVYINNTLNFWHDISDVNDSPKLNECCTCEKTRNLYAEVLDVTISLIFHITLIL